MEEKNRPQRRKPKKEKGDWFLTVSLVQIAFCAFFCLIVFVCIKTNADARESLRADFSALMNWSLEREDVQEVAALVREYFTSSGESVPVFEWVVPVKILKLCISFQKAESTPVPVLPQKSPVTW